MTTSGIVYVEPAYGTALSDAPVQGDWERGGQSSPGPGWFDIDEAIAWARARAAEVYVRVDAAIFRYQFVRAGELSVRVEAPVEHRRRIYSAGVDQHHAAPEVLPWPRGVGYGDSLVDRDYGGVVWISQREEQPIGDDLGFVVRHERVDAHGLHLEETVGPKWLGDLSGAIKWGRRRAPYVLLSSGPPLFEYWSVGDVALPISGLPEWRETSPSLADGRLGESKDQRGVQVADPAPGMTFPI